MKSLLAVAFLCLSMALMASANLRVAIHNNSCNSASLRPAYSTRLSITDQLNVDGMITGTLLNDADFASRLTTANYDVLYLGCGGKDLNLEALSPSAARAIVSFVSSGGGLVTSPTTATAFEAVRDTIADLLPFTATSSAWTMIDNGNSRASMTFELGSHYITTHNLTTDYADPLSSAFYVQGQPKSGWTSLAEVDPCNASCCLGFVECGVEYCDPYMNQGILVKQMTNGGRLAYINFAFCGYELYYPHNIRTGTINQLFLNMFYWASGKCKDSQECHNHGACIGNNQCSCVDGWTGNDCNTPICSESCQHGGQCSGPNSCTCTGHFSGTHCESCEFPWAGDDCTATSELLDPSFENSPTSWTLSPDGLVSGSVDGVDPYDQSKMLVLAGSNPAQAFQNLYIMNNNGSSPYLSFHYRSNSLSSGSTLKILVGDVVVWQTSSPATSWTTAVVNLGDYSSDMGSQHTLKIVGEMVGSDKFYVDLVEYLFPECNPTCQHGACVLMDSGTTACTCGPHYTGPTCDSPVCGDGMVILPETCDDGNSVSGDGCSSTCQVEDGWSCPPTGGSCTDICGDGRTMTNDPDACDDGNTRSGDGCSYDCKVERGYKCTRNNTSPSVCSIYCGDGFLFGLEKCDDGNDNNNDGCSNDCKINPGWECTDLYAEEGNECAPLGCGNGYRNTGEECDDNLADGIHGCTTDCKLMRGWYIKQTTNGHFPMTSQTTRCHDGITAGDEECDSGTGCSDMCRALTGYICTVDDNLRSTCRPICGDHIVVTGEDCDNGNETGCINCIIQSGYHCTNNPCTAVAPNVCGDGVVHNGEQCDLGNKQGTVTGCDENCQLVPGYQCNSTDCWTVCGDGVKTPDEFCDCGSSSHPNLFCDSADICVNCQGVLDPSLYSCKNVVFDGITYSSCRPFCGNGIRVDGEACDDNNTVPGDGCDSTCRTETGWSCVDTTFPGWEGVMSVCTAICGDGMVRGNETCDFPGGDIEGCVGCQVEYGYVCEQGKGCECKFNDGLMCRREQCDDSGKSCDQSGKNCGCVNGTIQPGWECRNLTGPESLCLRTGCGNGVRNFDEECDDGNTVNGDGCSSECKLESNLLFQCSNPEDRNQPTVCIPRVCGNGLITSEEECDDGNNVSGDGCSIDCKVETELFYECYTRYDKTPQSLCVHVKNCGDGFRHNEEGCDDGNIVGGDGCSSSCTVEDGWACEDNDKGKSVCHRSDCGNGKVEGSEQCDDGNNVDGDGCDSQCHIEPGFRCTLSGTISDCQSYCGDGLKASVEECDDGNLVDGDGCSSACKIEHGYNCYIDFSNENCSDGSCPSTCFATCGDGIVAKEEECDDGNTYQGDGCFNCKIESDDWFCRGEPSQCFMGQCTLPSPEVTLTHISCHGDSTGVIDVYVNTTEDIVYKVWNVANSTEPSSYNAVSHYVNLSAGRYRVMVAINGFEKCVSFVDVDLNEPNAFKNLKGTNGKQFAYPTSCKTSDGWISWAPSGGVKPYMFYFADRPVQEVGEYENVSIREFLSGKPYFIDANNCTREMDVSNGWPSSSWCEDNSNSSPKSSFSTYFADTSSNTGRGSVTAYVVAGVVGGCLLIAAVVGVIVLSVTGCGGKKSGGSEGVEMDNV